MRIRIHVYRGRNHFIAVYRGLAVQGVTRLEAIDGLRQSVATMTAMGHIPPAGRRKPPITAEDLVVEVNPVLILGVEWD